MGWGLAALLLLASTARCEEAFAPFAPFDALAPMPGPPEVVIPEFRERSEQPWGRVVEPTVHPEPYLEPPFLPFRPLDPIPDVPLPPVPEEVFAPYLPLGGR